MFGNVKLGVKIGAGFGIVLLLQIAGSVISLQGLTDIIGSVGRNSVAHKIVENTQNAMIAGKNFVITKDESHAQSVYTIMAENITLAKDLQTRVVDTENVKRLDDVITSCESYSANIRDYVALERSKQDAVLLVEDHAQSIDKSMSQLINRETGKEAFLVIANQFYLARIEANRHRLFQNTEFLDKATVHIKRAGNLLRELQTAGLSGIDTTVLGNIGDTMQAYLDGSRSYDASLKKQLQAQENAVKASVVTIERAKQISEIGEKLVSSTENRVNGILVAVGILSTLFGVLVAIFLTTSISAAMRKGVAFAEKIAAGDLSAETGIDQRDEIGQLAHALDSMRDKLKSIVRDIAAVASQVSSGSQELSATSQQMSQGATEQAGSVEEISASMEEMTATVKQNAENAHTTEAIARKSAQIAEEGGMAVTKTVEAMKQISSKVGIIEEIARSTNMLALNASIEAARAGEYGKGFAVVAAEVGKLAERSQKESNEIGILSSESVSVAESARETILGMIPDIKRTSDLVQEISAASAEQNSGTEQINAALLQLEQVVQQNASASEESASMSEELAGQAEQMQETISYFSFDRDRLNDTTVESCDEKETRRS